jgi:hypothetical protein
VTFVSPASISTKLGAAGLAAIAGVHLVWASGSSWPLEHREALADAVIGRPGGRVPSPAACLTVAGLLGIAASLVDGRPRREPQVSRIGATCVVTTLAIRAGLGLAGRTDLLSPDANSPRFRELDRRFYSPLCLILAVLALPATTDPCHGSREMSQRSVIAY